MLIDTVQLAVTIIQDIVLCHNKTEDSVLILKYVNTIENIWLSMIRSRQLYLVQFVMKYSRMDGVRILEQVEGGAPVRALLLHQNAFAVAQATVIEKNRYATAAQTNKATVARSQRRMRSSTYCGGQFFVFYQLRVIKYFLLYIFVISILHV